MKVRRQILSRKKQAILERRRQVAAYRAQGIRDQLRISRLIGCSVGTINADFKAIDEMYRELAAQDVATAKGHDLERVDILIEAIWPAAIKGDLFALDRVRALMSDRARILGLDAPKRSEITGAHGGPIEVEQSVTYSYEERQQRILAIVEQARARTDLPALSGRSDLDSSAGSTNGRVA